MGQEGDDLVDTNVLSMRDKALPGVMSDQVTPGPDQEDGRRGQDETLGDAMPGPSSGEILSSVLTLFPRGCRFPSLPGGGGVSDTPPWKSRKELF